MTITVTSLRLRSLWGFFKLSWMGFNITLQARKQKGFRKMKNTGFGYLHYTASAWESPADAKAFAHSGYHLHAMKQSSSIATEIRIYTFEGDQLPSWSETKKILEEKGRVFSYNKA
ncbi:DUF3291 domain-containing protein [Bdellovibrio sp. HCB337]|uniref:DUF3291 domain-containing protein n=1 Tax=Bdellovibrio sp. HCB337 TaxID=3394358 RepID=UPI0039A476C3